MKAYFFDLDGTLTDSRAGLVDCFRVALEAIGAPAADESALEEYLGAPLPVLFRAIRPDVTEAEIERGIAAFRDAYEREGIFRNRAYPGVRRMLERGRKGGHAIWVVTSKPTHYARHVVKILGLHDLVDGVVGAGLEETDTKTSLTKEALERCGVPAARTILLGDRHYDITGALENAVGAVGALWGYGTREEMEQAGCRDFVASPAEFVERYVDGTIQPRRGEPATAAARG